MDASSVSEMTAFLVPFLPTLTGMASKAGEEVGKQFGAEAFAKAKRIWEKLRSSVQAKPAALEAVQDVAADPSDSGAIIALERQFGKILKENPALANELSRIIGPALPNITVTASGTGSVAIGGNVSNSTISTGKQESKGE